MCLYIFNKFYFSVFLLCVNYNKDIFIEYIMNSLTNRDWELYNFGGNGATSEYDNILINKDIDNYFNDLVSKPIVPVQTTIKPTYSFDKFYSDYIEHNLIFIVVLIGIIIFLFIRHYVKDFDNDTSNSDKTENFSNNKNESNTDDDSENNQKQIEILKKKHARKLQIEKLRLAKYKRDLDVEKQKILSIIDELSNMNEYEYAKNQTPVYLNNQYNYIDEFGGFSGFSHNKAYQPEHYLNQNSNKYHNQINDIPTDAHNADDNSQYLNINKSQDDKTNEIEGLYIEPPFM
jgi:hypothetical protein